MLEVSLAHREAGAPEGGVVRAVEGWILGQDADGGDTSNLDKIVDELAKGRAVEKIRRT